MRLSHTVRFSGQKLRELRKARSWDQHRLADEARQHSTGITQASVSRHENGMQPTGRNAIAYARALGVEVTSLYELDDDEEEASSMASTREADVIQALAPLARLIVDALAVRS